MDAKHFRSGWYTTKIFYRVNEPNRDYDEATTMYIWYPLQSAQLANIWLNKQQEIKLTQLFMNPLTLKSDQKWISPRWGIKTFWCREGTGLWIQHQTHRAKIRRKESHIVICFIDFKGSNTVLSLKHLSTGILKPRLSYDWLIARSEPVTPFYTRRRTVVLIFFFRAICGKEENREPAGKDLMHSFFPFGPPA